MVGRSVEGLEVVVLGLHLGALGDLVAHADEDILDLPLRLGDEMEMAQGRGPARQADVDALLLQFVHQFLGLQRRSAHFEGLLEFAPDEVSDLSDFGPLGRRKLGDGAEKQGQIGLAAEEANPHALQGSQVGGLVDGARTLRVDGTKIGPRYLFQDALLR